MKMVKSLDVVDGGSEKVLVEKSSERWTSSMFLALESVQFKVSVSEIMHMLLATGEVINLTRVTAGISSSQFIFGECYAVCVLLSQEAVHGMKSEPFDLL
jgi:hypothetical protein